LEEEIEEGGLWDPSVWGDREAALGILREENPYLIDDRWTLARY
jgi:hypothetical protein